MTVDELIESLTLLSEDGLGEAEVMLGTQPTYPLASTLIGPVAGRELMNIDEDKEDMPEECDAEVVWLLEGTQRRNRPYAPRILWDLVG